MPITALPTPPTRNDPATFDTRADAFMAALPTFVTQANALESSLTASVHFGTSTTSVLIGPGAKSFTASTGKSWAVGAWLYIADTATPANYMIGNVTAYTGGTGALTVNVVQIGGSGTIASWSIGMTMPTGSLMGGAAGSLPYQSAASTTAFLAAGTAGLFLVAGAGAAPAWSSTLPATATATTPAIADNDTSVATGAFVRLVGPARASIVARSAAATLTAADASTLQLCSGATAYTLTLPAASAVPAGFPIEFVSSATVPVTISRAGTDTINGLTAAALTTMSLDSAGEGATLVSNGSNAWVFVSEPGRRTYESAWTATLPAASTATTFTHGLGAAPRYARIMAECAAADGTFAVGDRVMPWTGTLSGFAAPPSFVFNTTSLILTTTNTSWYAVPKTGGAEVILTAASWRYKVFGEV